MDEGKEIDVKILEPDELVLDGEKDIKVVNEVPTSIDHLGKFNPPGTEMIIIPNEPHVFKVDELTVYDPNHNPVKLTDTKVLMAHGIRSGGKWRFLDGANVVETVNSYNKYAQKQGLKPVEFLVVCNLTEHNPLGIRVGDFDANQNLPYAVGSNVSLRQAGMSKVENGRTVMAVASDQAFFGLDRLINHKKIQSQIKILS